MVFIPAASAIYDPIVAIVLLFLIDTAASAPILPPHFRNCRWREVGPMAAAASLAFPFGLLFLLSVDPVATRWVLSGFILVATAAAACATRASRGSGRPSRSGSRWASSPARSGSAGR